jgi:transposase
VASSLKVSPSTVFDCTGRAKAAGLSWPLPEELDDGLLESRLYPKGTLVAVKRAEPDFETVHKELKRKGVTLQLLWHEYKQNHPDDGYQYSQYCERYRRWRGKLDVVLRQQHRAGEKLFVDWSGDGIDVVDRKTGEVRSLKLFIAVLGASNYTYAEVAESEKLHDWIRCHMHAYEFLGGVPEATVPDNTKTAVLNPCFYEPDLNPTYHDMAKHYDTAVLPARARKPRDKAKVEGGVLIAQRWIVAKLRNHTFFSVAEVNDAVWQLLDELNERPFQKLEGSRLSLFESLDRPALRPLPRTRYVFADWSKPRVNVDYHVAVAKHFYSVPYQLVHKKVEARFTSTTVEVFHKGQRVASHARSHQMGRYTTAVEHMPKSHQRFAQWTPSRILSWAQKLGPNTRLLAEIIMDQRPHPEQGFRACLGILRLAKRYGDDRLEAACARSLNIRSFSYRSVESILKNGLDKQGELPGVQRESESPLQHENIRGSETYH